MSKRYGCECCQSELDPDTFVRSTCHEMMGDSLEIRECFNCQKNAYSDCWYGFTGVTDDNLVLCEYCATAIKNMESL